MVRSTFQLTFKEIPVADFERVVEVQEETSGLRAIIAIHNTQLGPALGGIRAYPYVDFDHALNDVLRLARGMTYKAAVAETGTGGGKSVIITDYRVPKSKELLLAFAEAVNTFHGTYICAEDFGMHVIDLETICKGTPYAVGLPMPKSSGDPSRFTAFGGFRGIQAVCKKIWGSDSVSGKTCAIQGLGSVGMRIAEHLFWNDAHLIVADIDPVVLARAVKDFGAQAVSPDEIMKVKCDIFVPCALGAILNPQTIPHLRCKAVAGLANNQLLSDQDGQHLYQREILYTPDYVINSGGLLAVCEELEPDGFHPNSARLQVDRIYDVLTTLFKKSDEKRQSTHLIAKELAEDNVRAGVGRRTQPPFFQGMIPALS